jgi:antirestriction protein ArdC
MQQRCTQHSDNRQSLYATVTDKIVGELEAGRLPWVQPWGGANAALGFPQNGATGRRYSGINILILWGAVIELGFAQQAWVTFRQALALGGAVRKGERGTTVVFADRFVPKSGEGAALPPPRDQDGHEPDRSVPFLKRFTLFNIEQCDGLPPELYAQAAPVPQGLIVPEAEALIRATGAKFRIAGDRAYYDPARDTVVVPPPQAFFEPINWHRTAFHELGHWTGHESRLAREQSGANGSKAYAREELVAEMAGAFVCASLNIVPTVRHADYLGEWLTILREDSRAIIRAASAASKAADYLLAFRDAPNAREDDKATTVDPKQVRPTEIPLVAETQR